MRPPQVDCTIMHGPRSLVLKRCAFRTFSQTHHRRLRPLRVCNFLNCGGTFGPGLGITPHSSSLKLERLPSFSPWQGMANNRSFARADQYPHLLQNMVSLWPCSAKILCDGSGCSKGPASTHSSAAKAPEGACHESISIALWRAALCSTFCFLIASLR